VVAEVNVIVIVPSLPEKLGALSSWPRAMNE